MKVLLLGLNYAPEPVGIAPYSAGMAAELVRLGHEVSAVVAKPYYPQWRRDKAYGWGWRPSCEDGVTILRCPLYVPSRPTGIKRLVHHVSFGFSALLPMLTRALRFRPDVVMTVAPSLIATFVALLAAKLAGAKYWLHVQDFEVEAAFATGLLGGDGRSARWARGFEGYMLCIPDRVSSISPQMCAKLAEKGVPQSAIIEFRNWADIDGVRPLNSPSPYRDVWRIDRPHVALYSGNIANKQGVEIILDAARRLRHRTDLQFVICGNGANRDRLITAAAGLDNVSFFDLQPKERLGELLGLASIHLLPQMAGAADLVLPSKLTNMLASGRPVIATAARNTGLAAEIEGCGLIVAPGDDSGMATAIEALLDDAETRYQLGQTARRRAEEHWSQQEILAHFASELAILKAAPLSASARG